MGIDRRQQKMSLIQIIKDNFWDVIIPIFSCILIVVGTIGLGSTLILDHMFNNKLYEIEEEQNIIDLTDHYVESAQYHFSNANLFNTSTQIFKSHIRMSLAKLALATETIGKISENKKTEISKKIVELTVEEATEKYYWYLYNLQSDGKILKKNDLEVLKRSAKSINSFKSWILIGSFIANSVGLMLQTVCGWRK